MRKIFHINVKNFRFQEVISIDSILAHKKSALICSERIFLILLFDAFPYTGKYIFGCKPGVGRSRSLICFIQL